MRQHSSELLLLVDDSEQTEEAVRSLEFVPPLRVQRTTAPQAVGAGREEPLLYLLGRCRALRTAAAILEWMDSLEVAGGSPVALLFPRVGLAAYPACSHPLFCGLIPCQSRIPGEAMELALHQARSRSARARGRKSAQAARIGWSLSTREAAEGERVWLGLQGALSALAGPGHDFSRLGMAFGEALTNAVEHGNLELQSQIKDEADGGLLRFFREREARLRQKRFARRRIEIRLELNGNRLRLSIRNQGRGFRPALMGPRTAGATSGLLHGMGLGMMEHLTDGSSVSADGRTVTLRCHLSRCRRNRSSAAALEVPAAETVRPAA